MGSGRRGIVLGSPEDGVPVLRTRSARRRRVLMPLLIVILVGIVALLLAGRGQQTQIIGAGSTLAQPLIERSAAAFRSVQVADDPSRTAQTGNDWVLDGSGIQYEPVGSLGGVMRLADPEVDFAVVDYPLSADGLAELGAAQFPLALGAVAVVHNLDLPVGQALRLDAPTVAQIYLGRVTRWNDPAITALNPDLALPELAITAVHRSDGSGSTYGFTGYLSAGSPDWAAGPGAGTTISWPAGTGAERTGGLIDAVRGVPGSIGYVEQGQAQRAGLRIAALRNPAGRFAEPGGPGMLAAVGGHDWSGRDDYVTALSPAGDPQAYPLTVAIYAVVKRSPEFRQDTERTLRYLAFVMEEYDGAAQDLGYLPLPPAAAHAVQGYWATVVTPRP
jgi:phosphate transport system substrate-binding protein